MENKKKRIEMWSKYYTFWPHFFLVNLNFIQDVANGIHVLYNKNRNSVRL